MRDAVTSDQGWLTRMVVTLPVALSVAGSAGEDRGMPRCRKGSIMISCVDRAAGLAPACGYPETLRRTLPFAILLPRATGWILPSRFLWQVLGVNPRYCRYDLAVSIPIFSGILLSIKPPDKSQSSATWAKIPSFIHQRGAPPK